MTTPVTTTDTPRRTFLRGAALTAGVAALVAARAAPLRNFRRGLSVTACGSFMEHLLRIDDLKCTAVADGSTVE